MDPIRYLVGGLVIYLSTLVGIWLTKSYREEIDQYERIIIALLQITFIALWTIVGWVITENILVAGILLASAVLGSIFIRLDKHIVFTVLSAAYGLVVVFSTAPYTTAGTLFIFGVLSSTLASRDRKAKRVLIRRLPFFILVLFGYLLSFAVA